MIVYVSIGNSDDMLSQRDWAGFVAEVQDVLWLFEQSRASVLHGAWLSRPDAPFQNACWCVEYGDDAAVRMATARERLTRVAGTYMQDSIAWAVVKTTEFLGPAAPPALQDDANAALPGSPHEPPG